MEISIQEHIIHRPILLANSVKVEVEEVMLNKSATLKILFANNNRYIWDETYKLTEDEYKLWNEDSFLIDLIIKKYNLKLT